MLNRIIALLRPQIVAKQQRELEEWVNTVRELKNKEEQGDMEFKSCIDEVVSYLESKAEAVADKPGFEYMRDASVLYQTLDFIKSIR